MKRNKFTDFILSLEEKMTIGNFYIQKKYVLIGILGIIIYILISIYNANSVRITNVGEKRDAEYKEVNGKQQIETFKEKPEDIKTYEESINEILGMSNEEIRAILKEQNIVLSDEDILKFKDEVRRNLPKTEEEMRKKAMEFKTFEEETMKKIYEEAERMAEEQKRGN